MAIVLPNNLMDFLDLVQPAIRMLRADPNLPKDVIDLTLDVDFTGDELVLFVSMWGSGISKHPIMHRNELMRHISVVDAGEGVMARVYTILGIKLNTTQTATSYGADEYDDILRAQDIMASIAPQS